MTSAPPRANPPNDKDSQTIISWFGILSPTNGATVNAVMIPTDQATSQITAKLILRRDADSNWRMATNPCYVGFMDLASERTGTPPRSRLSIGRRSCGERSLLGPERHHRIHMRGTSGRQVGRQHGDGSQEECDRQQGDWVGGTHAVEEACQDAA